MIVYLDNLRRKFAHRVAQLLVKTRITPNQITIFRFFVAAPLTLYFFSRGTYLYNLIGLGVYVSLAILDWVDGELARMTNQSSVLGKWLDDTSDRVLVLIVLASIFYGGMVSGDGQVWRLLAVLFFPFFFFLATTQFDFDRMFNLGFAKYPQVREGIAESDKSSSLLDWVLVNFIDVRRNSLTRFSFCISYPLFVGLILNQLLPAFAFITFMSCLRALGLLLVMYRALGVGETESVLTTILRELRGTSE